MAKQESLWRGSMNGIFFAKTTNKKTHHSLVLQTIVGRVALVEEENNLKKSSVESSKVADFLNFYHPHLSVKDGRKKLQH